MGSTSKPGSHSRILLTEQDRAKIRHTSQSRHDPLEGAARVAHSATTYDAPEWTYPTENETVTLNTPSGENTRLQSTVTGCVPFQPVTLELWSGYDGSGTLIGTDIVTPNGIGTYDFFRYGPYADGPYSLRAVQEDPGLDSEWRNFDIVWGEDYTLDIDTPVADSEELTGDVVWVSGNGMPPDTTVTVEMHNAANGGGSIVDTKVVQSTPGNGFYQCYPRVYQSGPHSVVASIAGGPTVTRNFTVVFIG